LLNSSMVFEMAWIKGDRRSGSKKPATGASGWRLKLLPISRVSAVPHSLAWFGTGVCNSAIAFRSWGACFHWTNQAAYGSSARCEQGSEISEKGVSQTGLDGLSA